MIIIAGNCRHRPLSALHPSRCTVFAHCCCGAQALSVSSSQLGTRRRAHVQAVFETSFLLQRRLRYLAVRRCVPIDNCAAHTAGNRHRPMAQHRAASASTLFAPRAIVQAALSSDLRPLARHRQAIGCSRVARAYRHVDDRYHYSVSTVVQRQS